MGAIKDAHEAHERQLLAKQVITDLPAAEAVAALPAADASLRGQRRFVRGGAGVADKLFVCVKTGTDTFIWAQIATG